MALDPRGASWATPGAGITHAVNEDSQSLRIFVVLCCALALYNVFELTLMIFASFKRFGGAYFWSMLVSGLGIIPYAIGFLLKFLVSHSEAEVWSAAVILTVGWYAMVTGQAFVLWSRLHLIVTGRRGELIIRYTKWMIILNVLLLHIPTTVLTFGSSGSVAAKQFQNGYNVMEKIQMTGFFVQETILSSIYIIETARILRTSLQPATRKVMKQLVVVNVFIIIMDLALISLEYASLYIIETLVKGVVYSVKLKLEFVILGRLVRFVGGTKPSADARKDSVGFVTTHKMSRDDAELDVRDFVNLDYYGTGVMPPPRSHQGSTSQPSTRRKSSRSVGANFDYDMARFEHIEDVATLRGTISRNSSASNDREASRLWSRRTHPAEVDQELPEAVP